MLDQRTHHKIVIVGPSDVTLERNIVEETIGYLNRTMFESSGHWLVPVHWETDSYPTFHPGGPQGAINEVLKISDAAVVVAVFSSRLGTPGLNGETGTENELRQAWESWKINGQPLPMIYFNDAEQQVAGVEGARQLLRLHQFRESLPKESWIWSYQGKEHFRKSFPEHLAKIIKEQFGSTSEREHLHGGNKPKSWRDLMGFPLHTFCGLRIEPLSHKVFQNFEVDKLRIENPNPVSYTWADVCRGSSINALLERASPPHLKITFKNKSMWPCNIAIRPFGDRALLTQGKTAITFEARLDGDEVAEDISDPEIFMTIRVINGWCQHWTHGPASNMYYPIKVPRDWEKITVSLDRSGWHAFNADGNRYYGPPDCDLSILSGLTLAFGGVGDNICQLGEASGAVLIRDVRLT